MVRYCLDELLGPRSHTETSAMRDLGIALANLSNEASGPVGAWVFSSCLS